MSIEVTYDEAPVEVPVDSGGDKDKLYHAYCECSETLSLCGHKLSPGPGFEADTLPAYELCVVCVDLDSYPCPRCGGKP